MHILFNRSLAFVSLALWITLFLVMALLSGCDIFTQKAAPTIAKGVQRYCREPLAERQLIRGQVNGMIAPNTVRVDCAGDLAGTTPTRPE